MKNLLPLLIVGGVAAYFVKQRGTRKLEKSIDDAMRQTEEEKVFPTGLKFESLSSGGFLATKNWNGDLYQYVIDTKMHKYSSGATKRVYQPVEYIAGIRKRSRTWTPVKDDALDAARGWWRQASGAFG